MTTAHMKRTTLRDHVPGWNLSGNEPGASCDGDSGPQGAHVDPKPGNHPELGPVLAPDVGPADMAGQGRARQGRARQGRSAEQRP
ncbi:hypothetical protein SAMN05216199_0475 [Pedococcus cremeus]|uniref:Uncharacterized protein n=1 Tax=Pedococcus cremeus TaxID=587636 RepID=A0A1H9XVA8_9MICO|nr:hypothetical protein [Pedococcus cremeus]SES49697.1 hypothetical protein SAMN05216199_0475 [Pedococcus cremeus]